LEDRNVLERVVFTGEEARARRARLVPYDDVRGQPIVVDAYNQLIGLECLLAEAPLFLAEDGVVRDIAAVRGGFKRTPATDRSIELICRLFARLGVESVRFVLDQQVAKSGELAAPLRHAIARVGLDGDASTSRHADRSVRRAAVNAVVCSSDRAIMDAAPRVFDVVRAIALEMEAPLGRSDTTKG